MARRTGAAVVNADSQQLYRGLRILSAGPSDEDKALAPHLLYEVAEPSETWSVGRWLRRAQKVLAEADGPLIFVGGTGLYFNALTKGLADIPPAPAGLRDEVTAAYDKVGEDAFRDLLRKADPAAAARIGPGDRQRLVRALSVALATGRSLTQWQAETVPVLAPGAYEAVVVERDRDDLYARCDQRVDDMMARGVLDEVSALLSLGLSPDLPVMKAVGVPELAAHLSGATPLDEAVSQVKTATRQYAKRQLTWFRNQAAAWPRG